MSENSNNNYLLYPLLILIIISVFTQFYYYDSVIFSSDSNQTQIISGTQSLNGSSQDIELDNANLDLTFDMQNGLLLIVGSGIALGLIGLQVVGSGLGERAQKIIWNGIIYYGLWAIFSILGYNSILSIPLFGALLWFMLTFFYSYGVFNKMG